MHNSSSHFTRIALAVGILAATSGAPAQNFPITSDQKAVANQVAQTGIPVEDLLPNAPDTYVVKRGDTLWAISGMFLKSAWRWPELWGMNLEQIRNPHLIYPGQILVLDKSSGRARLRMGQAIGDPAGTTRLSPRVRSSDVGVGAIASIPFHLIEPFLNEAVIFQTNQLETAPRIVATQEGRVLLGRGDIAYVRGDLGGQREYRIFRQPKPLRDPGTNELLGYEANFAGTSFATLEWKAKNLPYGSKVVNIVADKTQVNTLGAVGYDDEGVKTKRWDLIKEGKLVNYEKIRDQAHIVGQKESDGCCYSQSWQDVQFQRMPNVSLQPGPAKLSVDEMVSKVDKGIYIAGAGSFSIDQQRFNFQFGGQLFFAIEKGKITEQLEDVAYQSNTQEFWGACAGSCDASDYRLFGTFFDGKGQPAQVSSVSHGSATTRFNGVNVINTARKVG